MNDMDPETGATIARPCACFVAGGIKAWLADMDTRCRCDAGVLCAVCRAALELAPDAELET